jgi:DNA-binding PadR family transcriptional regulator
MTNAETAILTLLAEQPRYGYEIEQIIAERGMREWTEIGFSSIYNLLKKLEREGLVYCPPGKRGRPGPGAQGLRAHPGRAGGIT